MEEHYNFELLFDGEALKTGEIDVRDLAPSLLALSDLIEISSSIALGENARVNIKVKSDFKKGSFLVDLVSDVSFYKSIVDFINGDAFQAWSTVAGLVGISGLGIFQFLKKSKGKPIKKVVEIERSEKVRVTFEGGEEADVDRRILDLFKNQKARELIEKVVEPLKKDGIDDFGFNKGTEKTLRVTKEDLPYMAAPIKKDDEIHNSIDIVLRIVSPSFNPENKWRLSDGNRNIYASIVDNEFKQRIAARKELFGSGDLIRCRLTTAQWFEAGTLKSRYEIEEIYEHIASDDSKQIGLDEI